jgi:hypothetical protein
MGLVVPSGVMEALATLVPLAVVEGEAEAAVAGGPATLVPGCAAAVSANWSGGGAVLVASPSDGASVGSSPWTPFSNSSRHSGGTEDGSRRKSSYSAWAKPEFTVSKTFSNTIAQMIAMRGR